MYHSTSQRPGVNETSTSMGTFSTLSIIVLSYLLVTSHTPKKGGNAAQTKFMIYVSRSNSNARFVDTFIQEKTLSRIISVENITPVIQPVILTGWLK